MEKYKKAVILLNMGGPNSLYEVQIFLKNMFADPCILSIKNNMFRSMLGSIIVNARVEKSKKIYEKIGGYSPITPLTFELVQKLQSRKTDVFYTYAMRYTPPYSLSVLQEIMQKGITEIVLFSMYPQYSSTTSYSSFQDVALRLRELNFTPTVYTVQRYGNHPLFIQAITQAIIKTLAGDDASEFVLVLSAHSVPLSRIKNGDPYQSECEEGQLLIKEKLESMGIIFKDIILSYQSKVGPVKWIGPSTEESIKQYAQDKLIVYPLSFTIDNSETKYELCIEYRELAQSLQIKDYRVCPCLNDHEDFVHLIEALI